MFDFCRHFFVFQQEKNEAVRPSIHRQNSVHTKTIANTNTKRGPWRHYHRRQHNNHGCRWQNWAHHNDRNAIISPLTGCPSIKASVAISVSVRTSTNTHEHPPPPPTHTPPSASASITYTNSTNRKTTHSPVTAVLELFIPMIDGDSGIREGIGRGNRYGHDPSTCSSSMLPRRKMILPMVLGAYNMCPFPWIITGKIIQSSN